MPKTRGVVFEQERFWGVSGADSPPVATTPDKSRFKNHGTNTAITYTQLESGLFVPVFDGATSLINCGNDASLNTLGLTYIYWVRPTVSFAAGPVVIGKGGFGAGWYMQILASGQFAPYIKLVAGEITSGECGSTTLAILGLWYCVAFTYDGTTAIIYVNGVAEVSHVEAGVINTNATAMIIGSYFDGTLDFSGNTLIECVANYAFSPDEISNHFEDKRHWFGVN